MFVFKAAVVGAGTMGGEIAHVIANADIPVVLKDVDSEWVEQALEKARSLWQAEVDAGKLEPAELERKLALITGTTDYGQFGDVDFVIEAVPERHGAQAGGLLRARRGDPRTRHPGLQHLDAVDHRAGRGDRPPRPGGRLSLLLPGVA